MLKGTTVQEPSMADRIAKGRQEFNEADPDLQASHTTVVPPTKATPTVKVKEPPAEPPKTETPATGESGKPPHKGSMTDQELKSAGQKLFNERHFAEAIPLLKLAVEAFPKDVAIWSYLVLAASSMTRHDEAVEYAIEGIKHHPSSGWLLRQLGGDSGPTRHKTFKNNELGLRN